MNIVEAVALFGGPTAIVGGIKYLADQAKDRKTKREAKEKAWDDRLDAMEAAHADCLDRERKGLERMALEMRRAAEMALRPRDPSTPPPDKLPAPDWEENTQVRNIRRQIEKSVLDAELKRFVKEKESERPRPRMPSRPR